MQKITTGHLLLFSAAILFASILYGQCTQEKQDTFTVWPNHREEFTVKHSYRSMEIWWGEDFIFESQDTQAVISFVLGDIGPIGAMVQKDTCSFFSRDSGTVGAHIRSLLNGEKCENSK